MAKTKYSLYIILAGILWGIISLFINQLKALGFDSMQVVAIRVFFAALILVVYLLIKDKSQLKILFQLDLPCCVRFYRFCSIQKA